MTSKRGKSDFLELVKSDRPKPVKPPRLLAAIQQELVVHCERLLDALFSASDDVFYELSSRSENNSAESLYFDSMRKVRIARQGISRIFIQNLADNFSRLLNVRQKTPAESFSAHNLSLLEGDELEVDLALTNMVSRARDVYRESLHDLSVRLDHLLPDVDLQESINPLDPRQISLAFIEACADSLKIDIKIRLILFKLFEKHVLRNLAPVYAHANQTLIDAGIVPQPRQLRKGKRVPVSNKQPPQRIEQSGEEHGIQPAVEAPEGAPQSPRFNVSLDTIMSLMARARGTAQAAGSQGSPVINCYIFTTGNPGPVMTSPQLTTLLNRTQLQADRHLAKSPRNIVPEVVNALLRKADAESPQALGETDETIINLVSLFFEQTLADDNLPVGVYALICRLQIPILKVALQDSSFFTRHDHPARELINTITEAGIGFDENRPLERDPVYRKIADTVQTIAREYRVDEALFDQLHQELRAAIHTEQHKVSIVERRTSQSAAGRSRIRQARENARNLLYLELRDVQLPLTISEFLATAWQQVLIITQLKHGYDSPEWHANAECLADLIWLFQRHQDMRSLRQREQLQPVLMRQVKDGLEAAIESPEVRDAKVRELRAALHQINAEPDKVAYVPLTRQQMEALGRADAVEQAGPVDTDAQGQNIAEEYLAIVRQLPEGQWVEYTDEQSGNKHRYKLVAKVDPDAYIFVNRMGFKTLERRYTQLAQDMQCNRLKLLDCDEFFDRMMNKVMARISEAA